MIYLAFTVCLRTVFSHGIQTGHSHRVAVLGHIPQVLQQMSLSLQQKELHVNSMFENGLFSLEKLLGNLF